MVERLVANQSVGVRFSLAAPNLMSFIKSFIHKFFMKYGDNYVGNVHKGHVKDVSLRIVFV